MIDLQTSLIIFVSILGVLFAIPTAGFAYGEIKHAIKKYNNNE